MKRRTLDNLALGTVLAFILTTISFIAFFFFNEDKFDSFTKYMNYIKFMGTFSSIISLSALPNLLLFFLFIWTNRYRSARGVILAVMIITITVAILRIS